MKARKPELDFGDTLPIWTDDPEFSQLFNAFSIIIMELEPFMNRVMRRARDELHENDVLRNEIDVFVRQEANHTLIHKAYNQALYNAGYHRLHEFELRLKQDYGRYLDEWPLLDLVAYCESFEVLGPLLAELFFEQFDDVLSGAAPEVTELWRWHLAEEYEHRTVAFTTYHRLGGSWLHRQRMLYQTLKHLGRYRTLIYKHLREVDQQNGTCRQATQLQSSLKLLARRTRPLLFKRALRILSPFYDPARVPQPRGVAAYLN